MRSEVLTGMSLRTAGYEGELKILIKACKRGYGVVEIPIATRYTEGNPPVISGPWGYVADMSDLLTGALLEIR